MYVYIHVSICQNMSLYMTVYKCICMREYMYVCMHVCIVCIYTVSQKKLCKIVSVSTLSNFHQL